MIATDGSDGTDCESADESTADTTVTITFDGNGATEGSMKDQVVESDELFTLHENTYSRPGYTFRGWNTEKDASGTWWVDKAELTADKDMVLYAQWKGGPAPPEPTKSNPVMYVVTAIILVAAIAIALVLYWYYRTTKA